jgi:hypothetical protein
VAVFLRRFYFGIGHEFFRIEQLERRARHAGCCGRVVSANEQRRGARVQVFPVARIVTTKYAKYTKGGRDGALAPSSAA